MVREVAAWAGTAAVPTMPPAARTRPVSTAVEARRRRSSRPNADTGGSFRRSGVSASGAVSADDEGLVGARRVLALPLVQLLSRIGVAGAMDVQAQTAVAVLE